MANYGQQCGREVDCHDLKHDDETCATLSSASLFMMDLKERPSKAGVLSRERMLLCSFFSGPPMVPLPLHLLVPAAVLLERWL